MTELERLAAALTAEAPLIRASLSYTRQAFSDYRYPTPEGRQQRLDDVDRAVDALRALTRYSKTNSKGEING